MAQSGNGKATPVNMLETIVSRLAGITPDDYIAPKEAPSMRRHVIVGTASEHVKKLWTLLEQIDAESKPLVAEGSRLMEDVKQIIGGDTARGPEELVALVSAIRESRDIAGKAARLAEIERLARPMLRLQKFVKRLLWNEVRSCAPGLEKHQRLFLGNGWEVGYVDASRREDDPLAGLMEALRGRDDVQVMRL